MKITFIQTGGTIDKDYPKLTKGYAFEISEPAVKRILEKINPNFEFEIISVLRKDSLDITKEDMQKIHNTCTETKNDKIIITHGTDTMAYSSSAVSFAFQNLTKPIIFTGSQIPLARLRNDGDNNLITSMILASNFNIPEVMLVFNNQILRGNRAKKVSSNKLNAFQRFFQD